MAKKQKKDETYLGGVLPGVDIVGQKMQSGYSYINNESPERLSDVNYIPSHIQKVVSPFVRGVAKKMDDLTDLRENYDKNSPEHEQISLEMEKIAGSLPILKDQISKLNLGTLGLKKALGSVSPGSQDANLYTNFLVLAGQADSYYINDDGKLNIASVYGEGEEDISIFKLDDTHSPTDGQSPIIIEPYESKANIWRLAEETKQNQANGKSFDEDWIYKRLINELVDKGASNTIGLAFADLAGDNQTKSFADQWNDGLADPYFYTNPETGEPLQGDNSWMKDPNNYAILQKYLAKYITNIMGDIHGPVINEETGQVKKSQAQIAQDIVKKYSK